MAKCCRNSQELSLTNPALRQILLHDDLPMLRFTIRDLLWLMVVVSILGACWVDHLQYSFWDRNGTSLDMALRARNWHVIYSANADPVLISPEELKKPPGVSRDAD